MRRLGVDPPGGTLRHSTRTIRILTALVVLAVVVVAFPAAGGAANDTPKATEVGVDAETIHIATVADVDNPIAPGLFTGGVDGVRGAVKLINKQGGIGGRKLAMDFIDSHLNPNETRNVFITACGQDFALVGTGAFLGDEHRRHRGLQGPGRPDDRAPGHPLRDVGLPRRVRIRDLPVERLADRLRDADQDATDVRRSRRRLAYLNKKYGPLHGTRDRQQ